MRGFLLSRLALNSVRISKRLALLKLGGIRQHPCEIVPADVPGISGTRAAILAIKLRKNDAIEAVTPFHESTETPAYARSFDYPEAINR